LIQTFISIERKIKPQDMAWASCAKNKQHSTVDMTQSTHSEKLYHYVGMSEDVSIQLART